MTAVSRTCRSTGQNFEVPEAECAIIEALGAAHPLLEEPLPLPVVAPMEFMRMITSWGNLLNLFKSQSALSGLPQLSRYDPSLGIKICTPEEFWSEKVDNTDFGRPYDFSRPFFEQFAELITSAYFMPLNASNCEGSEYVNGANGAKNSYLCFGIFNSEDCMHSYMVRDSADCVDCIEVIKCQYCYDCHTMRNSYGCRYCRICSECTDCLFCEDCNGCNNCIFSFGLRRAEYCIANRPVSRSEYENFIADLKLDNRSNVAAAKQRFAANLRAAGHVTETLTNSEDSTGHFLTNVKDVCNSYYVHDAKDCGHILLSHNCSDFWRGFAERGELGYQAGVYADAYCTYNSYMIVGGSYNLYSLTLYNSCHHCFGSIGLNKKSYCILNRQYSQQEYNELVPRIVAQMKSNGEWGTFFPSRLAPFYYEQAFCNDWLAPIPLKEAARRGYRVGRPEDSDPPAGSSAELVPQSIFEVGPEILDRSFICPVTKKPFKFQKKEIAFHQRHGIPLPTQHWSERIRLRIAEVYLIPNRII